MKEDFNYDSKVAKTLNDFRVSYRFQSENILQTREDYEFYLGKQWSHSKQSESINNGQGKLTEVNNIRPYIHLLEGYQRQNRNDILAYPEGDEDSLQSEIVTRLIKNTMKLAKGEWKQSEQFKHSIIGGAAYLYPYMDYSRDLVFGELKFKNLTNLQVFYDPSSEEYDLSDARYICVFRERLSKEDIRTRFPEFDIDKISQGRIPISTLGENLEDGIEPYTKYYFKNNMPTNEDGIAAINKDTYVYDMLEYFYKKHRNKYFLINLENNGIIEGYEKELIQLKQQQLNNFNIPNRLVTQREAIVWRRVIVGDREVEDKPSEFSEYWYSYPIIPLRAYFCPVQIIDKGEYQVQGVVRPMKEPQKEKNIARIHASRHLMSSTNSGWLEEEGSFTNKEKVAKLGARPGVIVTYKKGSLKPERIVPMPLSSGFEFLSTQSTNDLKEVSGINSDLLSMSGGTDSGRAILLRQRQGLVMVQSLLDNQSQTSEQLGRFLTAILPIIYTTERALNVLGKTFLLSAFGVEQKQQDPQTGEVITVGKQINSQAASDFVEQTLKDKNLTNYNISIGEGVNSETMKFNNFLTLNEMVKNGYPIPPDILIEQTTLANATKEKIKNSFQRQSETAKQGENK
jgi:hypothetical protein